MVRITRRNASSYCFVLPGMEVQNGNGQHTYVASLRRAGVVKTKIGHKHKYTFLPLGIRRFVGPRVGVVVFLLTFWGPSLAAASQ